MKHQDQNIRALYLKFIDNKLTQEEILILFQKINTLSEEELENMVDEVIRQHEIYPVENEEESLDRILISVRDRLFTKALKPKTTFKLYYKWIAAAVIFLVSTLTLTIFFLKTNTNDQIEIAKGSEDIAPGKDRAILKLANGTEVLLDTLHSGESGITQDGASISKGGDGELVYIKLDANETAAVEFNTILTPRGGRYKVLLPDSTQVWLNAASSLTYPTSFANADTRTVNLVGEAYFVVKKVSDRNGKSLPFVVKTDQQQIKVLGTQFNVNAYSDEPNARTTLVEGRVEVNSDAILQPGQQAISLNKRLEVKFVDANTYVDWKNGEFNLKNSDFRTTMRKISRWYDVEIVYDPSAPVDVKLGGWISRDKNISSVLALIQKTTNIHFKLEGRRVIVTK